MFESAITELFKIKYPIIQGGMVWCSGWELVSAVSNAGGLGLLGAGSMYPEELEQNILKCKEATSNPFGVNLPLLYPDIEKHINTIVKHNIPIVFTSAGSPAKYTSLFKENHIKVVHVVSSIKFALKAQSAGCDAVVLEGFEAGGHNGREESTTFTLLQLAKNQLHIPIIAAGGIGSGEAILASRILGAAGVQIGTLFAASKESAAHENYKNFIFESKEGDTDLVLKSLTPVRMLKNNFYQEIKTLENQGATPELLREKLGKGRSKKGIREGNLEEGELEIGQISALINELKSVEEILQRLLAEYKAALAKL